MVVFLYSDHFVVEFALTFAPTSCWTLNFDEDAYELSSKDNVVLLRALDQLVCVCDVATNALRRSKLFLGAGLLLV